MDKLRAILTIIGHPVLYAKYAERITKVQTELDKGQYAELTPEMLGWHQFTFVMGKKTQAYVDGQEYAGEDMTVGMWLSKKQDGGSK